MAIRSQIYLAEEQKARLAALARSRGVPMSQLIREAVDTLLESDDDLDATFGSAPGLVESVPDRAEWARDG